MTALLLPFAAPGTKLKVRRDESVITLLAQIFIGWPAILGSLALSATGIARKQPAWLIGGAVLVLGFAWYLSAWPLPIAKALGYALPFLHVGAAVAVQRGNTTIAWLLLLPHAAVAAVLGFIVLTQ